MIQLEIRGIILQHWSEIVIDLESTMCIVHIQDLQENQHMVLHDHIDTDTSQHQPQQKPPQIPKGPQRANSLLCPSGCDAA